MKKYTKKIKYFKSQSDIRKRASKRAVLAEIFSKCGNYLPTLPL